MLAVDDLALIDVGRRGLFLIQHHRPKKVDGTVFSACQEFGKLAGDVLPLHLSTPDVPPLKQRNFEAHLLLKWRATGPSQKLSGMTPFSTGSMSEMA